jgi:hypothetical protein
MSEELQNKEATENRLEEIATIKLKLPKKQEYYKPTVLVRKQASYQSRPPDKQVHDAKSLVF